MKKLTFRPIYLLNALWLAGLMHILYYGFRPYKHYRYEDRVQPDTQAVILTLGLFSLFFIVGNIIQLIPIWKKFRYQCYIFLSAVLIFQTLIAFMGAMHAPPYWAAFIINSLFLLFIHFLAFPIWAIYHTYKNTAQK